MGKLVGIPDMFEKEAEEYKLLHTHYEVAKREDGSEYAKSVINVTIQEAFRQGAEFGYNKANEWHNCQSKKKRFLNKKCPSPAGGLFLFNYSRE